MRFAETCRGCGTTRVYDFMGSVVQGCNCAARVTRGHDRTVRLRAATVLGTAPGLLASAESVVAAQQPEIQDNCARRLAVGNRNRSGWALFYKGHHGDACHYCREKFTDTRPPTIEHVKPLSEGGTGARANLVLACGPCNNARATAPFNLYMQCVERAHEEARQTGDGYKRPKYRQTRGGFVIA